MFMFMFTGRGERALLLLLALSVCFPHHWLNTTSTSGMSPGYAASVSSSISFGPIMVVRWGRTAARSSMYIFPSITCARHVMGR